MSKILKNTTASIVSIGDVGQQVPASGQLTINPNDYLLYADSSDVIVLIGNGTLLVNDGSTDLSIADGSKLIQGIFPNPVGISGPTGVQIGNVGDNLKVTANFSESNSSVDLADRLRVANEEQLFSVLFNYDKTPQVFSEQVSNGATVESAEDDSTNPAYVKFNMPTTSGASIVFGSKRYLRYQPNRTHTNTFSAILGEGDANQNSRYGIFDDGDGFYWAKLSNVWNVGYRNSTFQTAGTTIETNIAQPDWDDPLDGTGASGLDYFSNNDNTGVDGSLDKDNTFLISWLWHGASQVQWVLNVNGKRVLVHSLNPSAQNDKPFTKTALLPFRFEIENTGTISSANTQYLGPVSFDVNGGNLDEQGFVRSYHMGNDDNLKSIGAAFTNIIALRCKSTFRGQDSRALILPEEVKIFGDDAIVYEVWIDAIVTGGTWVSQGADSVAEINEGAFSFTGGRRIDADLVNQDNKEAAISRSAPVDLFVSNDSVTGDQLAIVLRVQRYATNTDALGGFTWREVY